MPSWRKARVVGASVIAAGVAGIVVIYPYISGEPGSVAESEIPDPSWTRVVGDISIGPLVVGLLVLLVPIGHWLLVRRRP